MPKTVGLPRMHKEPGERRDFLPDFVRSTLEDGTTEVVLEEGYGSGMGIAPEDYLACGDGVRFAPLKDCLACDLVLWLRWPDEALLAQLREGATLISMVHYPTRPARAKRLQELGVRAVSLDSLVDDHGARLVENLESVGWNGVRFGFEQLARTYPGFDDPRRGPLRATVLGSGAVGMHAVRAASRYGDPQRWQTYVREGFPGVEVTVLEHDLTRDEAFIRERLSRTDLLVDATKRPDASRHVLRNGQLEPLPKWAVIVDLSVDPYDFACDPPEVKGIEGLPEGNLDQWIFEPDDPAYSRLDARIESSQRRVAVTCYSWPGVRPRECMAVYGRQLAPLLRVLSTKELDALQTSSDRPLERALARADSKRWLKTEP